MKCPRCVVPLEWKSGTVGGLNSCPKCQGLWLNNVALKEAMRKDEAELVNDFSELPGAVDSILLCPSDAARMRIIACAGVELDTCPECKGLWLDKGEWEKLVSAHRTHVGTAVGVAAAAVGGAAVVAGAAAQEAEISHQSSSSMFIKMHDASGPGDIVCDMLESGTKGLLDGAFSAIGSICSSIFE